ncbi:ABC transporter ATP-binding protein [Pseudonocardia sp. HH130629-09]|uniref:ABC transporter ATP-binding protein n=1 Tax=Pseudonocardia sp. HH130629-09 TaxID=1641402 RepID=UPI0006CB53E5|nr:ATP-binding cassette domain-containing protein [Pseudonocardia sp. HH130629-09]ALE81698.1 hypothetical protein XF36_00030 [Pseudonocardia sp. HH130629-09]
MSGGDAPVLEVRGLGATTADGAVLLDGVDLALDAGRVLAVVGPSGAGKSTLGLALLGEAATGVRPTGSVRVAGTELVGPDPRAVRAARAGRVGHLPQHPGIVLDPVRRAGPVLDELAATVHGRGRAARDARAAAVRHALDRAGLGDEPQLATRFPHQLSGGQQQRMALALTLVTAPAVIVLDEPTTGLDPATTRAVVDRLATLAAGGTALVLLTHDLDSVRRLDDALGDRAPVGFVALDRGRVTARGDAADLPATAAGPDTRGDAEGAPARLAVRGLGVRTAGGVDLLTGVDLDVAAGELVAVVGPSGAGKTTLGRALAGLVPSAGTVRVDGAGTRRPVQYVHQDCRSAFLDHRPVLDQVARPGVLLHGRSRAGAHADAAALLARLGVARDVAARRPGGLSGGQLQRASVARALLARPAVLVADEATSALDAEHRALVLAELRRACGDGLAVVLVSHDPVAVSAADRVVTVADGRVLPTPDPVATG